MFYFLAEYRHQFMKADGTMSKSGMVGWIGSGTIFDFEQSLITISKPNGYPISGLGIAWKCSPV